MSTCEEVLCYQEEGYRTPDHSLLRWDLTVGTGIGVSEEEDSDKGSNNKVFTKYFVPHGYMGCDDDQIFIQSIMDDLRNVQGDPGKLDDVYNELVLGMKSRLKKVTSSSKKGGSHGSQKTCLSCGKPCTVLRRNGSKARVKIA